jgi:signal transduction histidine kinase
MTTPANSESGLGLRVLVLAPLGRNADVLRRVVVESGLSCTVCADAEEVCREVQSGAGALLLTSEALNVATVEPLIKMLARQPTWSDLPLVIVGGNDEIDSTRPSAVALFRRLANVTLLERPTRGFTLATVLHSAVRARQRQFETRDLLRRESDARAEAERANRTKDEFLATVSHELGTPLSAILLWSKLALTGTLPPEEFPRTFELIYRSALAQNVLIDDLLDAARMVTGKLLIIPSATQLAPAVNSALEIVRPTAKEGGVQIMACIDESAGVVQADLGRMRQVAWNLLNNAVKFTPAGGTITVTLRKEAPHVRLQVTDNGRGITAEFLPHVFERFWQADGGTTRQSGGVGLGLAISKKIVELHGGTITAESAGLDQGATFTVALPLVG